jgi:hypothetical protein
MYTPINRVEHSIHGLVGIKAGGRISKCLSVGPVLPRGTEYFARLFMTDSGEIGPYRKSFWLNVCIPVGYNDFQSLREAIRNLLTLWAEC